MVTGGVKPEAENLKRWFGEGAVAVGMGSALLPKDLLAKKDYAGIRRRSPQNARTGTGVQISALPDYPD